MHRGAMKVTVTQLTGLISAALTLTHGNIISNKNGERVGIFFQIANLHKYAYEPDSQCGTFCFYFAFHCFSNIVSIGNSPLIPVPPPTNQTHVTPLGYL